MLWVMLTLIIFIIFGAFWLAIPTKEKNSPAQLSERQVSEIVQAVARAGQQTRDAAAQEAEGARLMRAWNQPPENTWSTTSTTYVRLYANNPEEAGTEEAEATPEAEPEPRSRFARLASLQDRDES